MGVSGLGVGEDTLNKDMSITTHGNQWQEDQHDIIGIRRLETHLQMMAATEANPERVLG